MADDVMRVELTTPGLDRSVQQVERLAAAYDRLAGAEERIGKASGGGGGGGGGGSKNAVGSEKFLTGPRQQMQQVEAQIRRAEAEKNEAARGDLLDRRARLERSVRLNEMRRKRGDQGPGLLELFGDLNSLMRGIGGGSMGGAAQAGGSLAGFLGGGEAALGGLGGGAAGLGGLAAAAGPAAIALGAAAAGAAAFAAVVQQSTSSLRAFGQATGMSGGTGAQVGALIGAGFGAGDIAARGARIRALRANDPYVMGILGYALPTELSGDQNDAAQLLFAREKLKGMRAGSPEQLRAARLFQMEDMLGQINVSPWVRRMQDRTGNLSGFVNDPQSVQAARDLTEAQRNMAEQWNLITTEMGKPAVGLFVDALKDINRLFDQGSKGAGGLGAQLDARFGKGTRERVAEIGQRGLDTMGKTLAGGAVGGPLGALYGFFKGLTDPAGSKKTDDVQKRQLEELQKLNRAIAAGTYGGSTNAQNALPAHLRGWYVEEAARGRYRRYGSIGI